MLKASRGTSSGSPISTCMPLAFCSAVSCCPRSGRHRLWKNRLSDLLHVQAHATNGAGRVAELAVTEIGRMTGRRDLAQLSCLNFVPFSILDGGSLLDEGKRWCPACWREGDEGEGRYERKLWLLPVVEVCPIHQTVLVERCFSCGMTQPAIARDVRVGTCAHCGDDLCSSPTKITAGDGSDGLRQLWYAEQAALFILGVDTCALYGTSASALAEAQDEGLAALELALRHSLGHNHDLTKKVGAWSEGASKVGLELFFSALWVTRWPVESFFPHPVREILRASASGSLERSA